MAIANNNGWDFIKVGEVYQYKEDGFIAFVKILDDNSDDEYYHFKVQVIKANSNIIGPEPFDVVYLKNATGMFSGMVQFYQTPEYGIIDKWVCNYKENE